MLLRTLVLTFSLSVVATTTHAKQCSRVQYRAFNALDVNGDGLVVPLDYLMSIVRIRDILNGRPATPEEKIRLDVNGDQHISNIDMLQLINMYNAINQNGLGECPIERLRAHSIGDGHKRTLNMNSFQYWGVVYNIWSEMLHAECNLPPSISLDFNKDGKVNAVDVLILRSAYGDLN